MKGLLLLLLPVLLACTSNDTSNDAPSVSTPVTTTDSQPEATADPDPFAEKSLCEVLSSNQVKTILTCGSDLQVSARGRDLSRSCSFTCTDPFAMIQLTVSWRADGSAADNAEALKRDDNPAFERVSVPGLTTAHLQPQQNRLVADKGPYSIVVVAAGQPKEMAVQLAQLLVSALPQ